MQQKSLIVTLCIAALIPFFVPVCVADPMIAYNASVDPSARTFYLGESSYLGVVTIWWPSTDGILYKRRMHHSSRQIIDTTVISNVTLLTDPVTGVDSLMSARMKTFLPYSYKTALVINEVEYTRIWSDADFPLTPATAISEIVPSYGYSKGKWYLLMGVLYASGVQHLRLYVQQGTDFVGGFIIATDSYQAKLAFNATSVNVIYINSLSRLAIISCIYQNIETCSASLEISNRTITEIVDRRPRDIDYFAPIGLVHYSSMKVVPILNANADSNFIVFITPTIVMVLETNSFSPTRYAALPTLPNQIDINTVSFVSVTNINEVVPLFYTLQSTQTSAVYAGLYYMTFSASPYAGIFILTDFWSPPSTTYPFPFIQQCALAYCQLCSDTFDSCEQCYPGYEIAVGNISTCNKSAINIVGQRITEVATYLKRCLLPNCSSIANTFAKELAYDIAANIGTTQSSDLNLIQKVVRYQDQLESILVNVNSNLNVSMVPLDLQTGLLSISPLDAGINMIDTSGLSFSFPNELTVDKFGSDNQVFVAATSNYKSPYPDDNPVPFTSVRISMIDSTGLHLEVSNLTEPVRITIRLSESNATLQCAYLDTKIGKYATDGLVTVHNNNTSITCLSTHLTIFAIVDTAWNTTPTVTPNTTSTTTTTVVTTETTSLSGTISSSTSTFPMNTTETPTTFPTSTTTIDSSTMIASTTTTTMPVPSTATATTTATTTVFSTSLETVTAYTTSTTRTTIAETETAYVTTTVHEVVPTTVFSTSLQTATEYTTSTTRTTIAETETDYVTTTVHEVVPTTTTQTDLLLVTEVQTKVETVTQVVSVPSTITKQSVSTFTVVIPKTTKVTVFQTQTNTATKTLQTTIVVTNLQTRTQTTKITNIIPTTINKTKTATATFYTTAIQTKTIPTTSYVTQTDIETRTTKSTTLLTSTLISTVTRLATTTSIGYITPTVTVTTTPTKCKDKQT